MEKSMTALMSAFARGYHHEHRKIKVYDDPLAKAILGSNYPEVEKSIIGGLGFLLPGFSGSESEGLMTAVDKLLSPTPLGRAAFTEAALKNAAEIGAEQYLIIAAGFESFPYRQPMWAEPLEIFELDLPEMTADKKSRLSSAGIEIPENVHYLSADVTEENWTDALKADEVFDSESITFVSCLGLTQYLSKEELASLLKALFSVLPEGSSIAFDYSYKASEADIGSKKRAAMALAAGEEMRQSYTETDMEHLLAECGLLLYEHISAGDINNKFFARANYADKSHEIKAPADTAYALAVKKL